MANEVMCPYCGAMISDQATVCRHCGRMLTGSVKYGADGSGVWYGDAPDGHTGEEAERLRRRSRGILWLVIALCTLLVVAFIGIFTYLAFDLARGASDQDRQDVDELIHSITEEGTLPESVLPDDVIQQSGEEDIGAVPDLVEGAVSDQYNLVIDYVEALQANDHAAAAQLFHPAILEAYALDADAMLTDLDAHFAQYGTALSGWKTADSEPVDADGLAQLDEALPVGIDQAEVHLLTLTPASGEEIEVFLLLVHTAEGWSLYYSY